MRTIKSALQILIYNLNKENNTVKCPHCEKKISILSKALNKFKKIKQCPHCNQSIKNTLNFKIAILLIIPCFTLSIFIVKPILVSLGLYEGISTGFFVALIIILSMRLEPL